MSEENMNKFPPFMSWNWLLRLILDLSIWSSRMRQVPLFTHPGYKADWEPGILPDAHAVPLCSTPTASSDIPAGVCRWCAGRRGAEAHHTADMLHIDGSVLFSQAPTHTPSQTRAGWSCPDAHCANGRIQSCTPEWHPQKRHAKEYGWWTWKKEHSIKWEFGTRLWNLTNYLSGLVSDKSLLHTGYDDISCSSYRAMIHIVGSREIFFLFGYSAGNNNPDIMSRNYDDV